MNLVSAILSHARTRPDAPALAEIHREIDYRSLALAVARTAGYLTARGVVRGDRVGLRLKNSADHVILFLALGLIGAVAVPLDWRGRPREIAQITRALGLKQVIAEAGASLPPDSPAVLLDGAWRRGAAQAEPLSQATGAEHDTLAISVTSGSTGAAKFIAVSHFQFFCRARGFLQLLGLCGRHRFLCTLPLGFGAWPRTLAHLLRGDCVIVYPSLFGATEYVEVARRAQATIGGVVPTTIRQLLAIATDPPLLPGMTAFLSGGAPLAAEEKRQAQRLLTPNFFEQFGTTEFGTLTVLRPADLAAHAHSVGQPHTLCEIEIVDADDRPLPTGVAGRLRYRGPGLGSPVTPIEGPAAPHGFRQGWHYPDEIADLDDRSFLSLHGRSSDVINRGGAKFYPIEIETVLNAHEGVVEAAVLGRRRDGADDEVIAFVVPRGDGEASRLIAHSRAHLASHKVPQGIRFVAELPRTPLGKVDKPALATLIDPGS